MVFYRFQSFQSRDVQEGDTREVQDQAVDVHSGNTDVSGKVCVPVNSERKVLDVKGQIKLLVVLIRLIRCLAK